MLNFKAPSQNCSFCGGHLQEMVAYEHQTKGGGLLQEEVHTHLLSQKNLLPRNF